MKYVNVGYSLDKEAVPRPLHGELQIEQSVDDWAKAPDGYICFFHNDREFYVPKSDLDRFACGWSMEVDANTPDEAVDAFLFDDTIPEQVEVKAWLNTPSVGGEKL